MTIYELRNELADARRRWRAALDASLNATFAAMNAGALSRSQREQVDAHMSDALSDVYMPEIRDLKERIREIEEQAERAHIATERRAYEEGAR